MAFNLTQNAFPDSLLLRFSVCFQQILKRLLRYEVWRALWQMPWTHDFVTSDLFLYFYLKKLLCNSTEVATIANWKLCRLLNGALLSHRCVLTQSAFTVHYACVYHLIFSKSWRWWTQRWRNVERRAQLTTYSSTHDVCFGKKKLPLFLLLRPSSVTASVRISVSRCTRLSGRCSGAEQISSMTAWTIRCDDLVCGCSALF